MLNYVKNNSGGRNEIQVCLIPKSMLSGRTVFIGHSPSSKSMRLRWSSGTFPWPSVLYFSLPKEAGQKKKKNCFVGFKDLQELTHVALCQKQK